MGGTKKEELLSGEHVQIAYTDDLKPPAHGEDFDKEWKEATGRKSLKFYDSTVDYMRNEWAMENMRHRPVELDGKHVELFYHPETKTWNSAEALDIDHKTQWKTHFEKLEVWSKADAMLAYNDAGNLRTIPATYNRARDSADGILQTHGADSAEWASWVDKKMRFDTSVDYPNYDPDTHSPNRNAKTTGAIWKEGTGRETLGFDDSIKEIWLKHALKDAYAGEVKVPDPDHPNDRSKDHSVQLFECAATKQLVTMGGLDIDHEIPFNLALKKMLEMNQAERESARLEGRDDVPPISKADVLDLYNNPENLRLVARGANSSHEWELGLDGELYDPELDDVEYATAEPTVLVVDDDEPLVMMDEPVHVGSVDAQSQQVPIATLTTPSQPMQGSAFQSFDDFVAQNMPLPADDAPSTKKHQRDGHDEDAVRVSDDAAPERSTKWQKPMQDDVAPIGIDLDYRRHVTLGTLTPQDAQSFDTASKGVAALHPLLVAPMSEEERDNVAMALVRAAREKPLPGVDHVVASMDGSRVFAISGPLMSDGDNKVSLPLAQAKLSSFDTNAQVLAALPSVEPMDAHKSVSKTAQL
jgi:hypothetical protein